MDRFKKEITLLWLLQIIQISQCFRTYFWTYITGLRLALKPNDSKVYCYTETQHNANYNDFDGIVLSTIVVSLP